MQIKIQFYTTDVDYSWELGRISSSKMAIPRNWKKDSSPPQMNYYMLIFVSQEKMWKFRTYRKDELSTVISSQFWVKSGRCWVIAVMLGTWLCPKNLSHNTTARDFKLRWEKSFWLNEMILLLGVSYSMGLCNPQITGSNYFSKWKWFKIKFEKNKPSQTLQINQSFFGHQQEKKWHNDC